LAKVKEVMLTKALDGDAHAARAFATILTTQKELSKGAAPAPEKPVAIAAEIPRRSLRLLKWKKVVRVGEAN